MYHALDALQQPRFKWLNLMDLAKSFLTKNDELVATYYFTAVHTHDPQRCRRHRRYIDALRAAEVEIVESKFQSVDKFCRRTQQSCPFLEEKQTDVALATQLVADAMENFMDRAVLITADSDHVPAVRLILKKRPLVTMTLAPPPGRMQSARDLGALITDRREITIGRMERCLFPRTVYAADGKQAATCPAAYMELPV